MPLGSLLRGNYDLISKKLIVSYPLELVFLHEQYNVFMFFSDKL